VIAAAAVASPGFFVTQTGFAGIAHDPGTGVYTLQLASPPPNLSAGLVITALQISPAPGVAGQITNTALTAPDLIEITTYDATGVPTDRSFYIVVYDLTP